MTGKVTISAAPTFTNLTLGTGKKLHNVDIGTCAVPKILLKSGSCVADNTQTVTGSITFTTDKNKPLTLNKTVLAAADSKVNEENFANILSSLVSKTKQVEETFTKKKTFKQAHFNVDPSIKIEITKDVFGLFADLEGAKFYDMSYPSGNNEVIKGQEPLLKPVMPKLVEGMDKVAENSLLLQDQFSHMTPIYTTLDQSLVSKSIPIFTEHNVATKAQFNALPFHIATFYGDTSSGRVGILFHRMSALQGDIKLTGVPEEGENIGKIIGQGSMARDNNGNNLAFGQIVSLRVADGMRYVILLKKDDGTNEVKTYKYDSNAATLVLIESASLLPAPFEYITPLGPPACFASCGPESKVFCLESDKITETKKLNSTNCFQSSSVSVKSRTMLATAAHQSMRTGTIDIYDVTKPADAFHLQTINCHMCSHTALGRYKNQIFIVVLSWTYDFVSVGKWDPTGNEGKGAFKVFQSLKLSKPSDAVFFNHDEFLYLSITTGNGQNTEIKRFMFRGEMAFTEMVEMNLKLVGIQSHSVIAHPLLDNPLVSSTGNVIFNVIYPLLLIVDTQVRDMTSRLFLRTLSSNLPSNKLTWYRSGSWSQPR